MGVISTSAPSYSDEELQRLRDTLKEVGVEYVMATYADGHGIAKCKTVPIDHFAQMMRGSELFTGAALDLLGQSPADDELAVYPDPSAVVPLPWRPNVAFAPGNLYLRGEAYPMCSRTVLSKQVARARERGFVFNLGMRPSSISCEPTNGAAHFRGTRGTCSKSRAMTRSGCSSPLTSSTRWFAT